MSIYSRVKCTKEQLSEFKKKVCDYLIANSIDLSKIKMRCQRNYDGNVKILTYKTEMKNNKVSRRHCTVEKDDVPQDGWYKGHFDTKLQMGVFFYRTEWEDYLKSDPTEQRKWDLDDIKKHIEIKIRRAGMITSTINQGERMKVIATIKKSAGNETVGDMWNETRVFDETQAILEVFEWAKNSCALMNREHLRANIILTVAQE